MRLLHASDILLDTTGRPFQVHVGGSTHRFDYPAILVSAWSLGMDPPTDTEISPVILHVHEVESPRNLVLLDLYAHVYLPLVNNIAD